MADVHERFAKALSAIGAIAKGSKNQHHGYVYRGIDDVMNALHGVLADHGLFYVPKLVGESYEEWQTSKGKRMQVARLAYEFVFYAADGSSLTVGPVVGQSADTDDKAPMQALSQAAKPALLHAFCIPTEDLVDGDATSAVEAAGGRASTAPPAVRDRVNTALRTMGATHPDYPALYQELTVLLDGQPGQADWTRADQVALETYAARVEDIAAKAGDAS